MRRFRGNWLVLSGVRGVCEAIYHGLTCCLGDELIFLLMKCWKQSSMMCLSQWRGMKRCLPPSYCLATAGKILRMVLWLAKYFYTVICLWASSRLNLIFFFTTEIIFKQFELLSRRFRKLCSSDTEVPYVSAMLRSLRLRRVQFLKSKILYNILSLFTCLFYVYL